MIKFYKVTCFSTLLLSISVTSLLSIDSLVMISIEKSETNKKRALEIQDKFVSDHGQC